MNTLMELELEYGTPPLKFHYLQPKQQLEWLENSIDKMEERMYEIQSIYREYVEIEEVYQKMKYFRGFIRV